MAWHRTVREVLNIIYDNVLKNIIGGKDENGNVQSGSYFLTALKGGVGYEYPLDAWFNVKKGQRWNVVLVYNSNLSAGSSYTSSSILSQDGSINNYLNFRMVVHNEGSTNVEYKIQQSNDNSTWYDVNDKDGNPQSITLTSDGTRYMNGDITMPYIRVVESNNDSNNAQTGNLIYLVLY